MQHWFQLVLLPSPQIVLQLVKIEPRNKTSVPPLSKTFTCAEWKSVETEAVSVRATSTYSTEYSMVLVVSYVQQSIINRHERTQQKSPVTVGPVPCKASVVQFAMLLVAPEMRQYPGVARQIIVDDASVSSLRTSPTDCVAPAVRTKVNQSAAYETSAASHTYTTRAAIPTTNSARD